MSETTEAPAAAPVDNGVRELVITYDMKTDTTQVKGPLQAKNTCYMMLKSAEKVVDSFVMPAPKP